MRKRKKELRFSFYNIGFKVYKCLSASMLYHLFLLKKDLITPHSVYLQAVQYFTH